MAPQCALPLSPDFTDVGDYVESLLGFSTSSDLFQTLCGGVQVLDFFTGDPDPYSTIFPSAWRRWFADQDVHGILDLLLRDDLIGYPIRAPGPTESLSRTVDEREQPGLGTICSPPPSLIEYIRDIRRHSLNRSFSPTPVPTLVRDVAVGMKPKKIHEVEHFARYVDQLADEVSGVDLGPVDLVDFGSGQNYLGRALASEPYNRHIIAVESIQNNIEVAREMDVTAKLSSKAKVMRNKKQYRLQVAQENDTGGSAANGDRESSLPRPFKQPVPVTTHYDVRNISSPPLKVIGGHIQYVEHRITDGKLDAVIQQLRPRDGRAGPDTISIDRQMTNQLRLMIISLHSCGNLVHHGLRALVENPSVVAVALVGCCYNRMTERLGPGTNRLPKLRSSNARVVREEAARDPRGFPMSERLATYPHRDGEGLRLNVTARMMAVQAPQNWTRAESEAFFNRHFFRALFQRILFDRGLVCGTSGLHPEVEPPGPIIIGSLRKACYSSFTTYVRAAVAKLTSGSESVGWIGDRLDGLSDVEVADYESRYSHRKAELSIAWSFMAFSAIVAESIIVVDRWCFLREQGVRDCWVDVVFEHRQSPRNLVVVGIK